METVFSVSPPPWYITRDLLTDWPYKWQTRPLVREDAPIEQDSDFHIGGRKKNLVVGPRRVLDTKTYWLTDRPSVAMWLWLWLWLTVPRVEAGSNTSTVTLRVVGGDKNGSLKCETVKYGRKSQGTRTRETLRGQEPAACTKDRPILSPERAPNRNKTVTVEEQ
jgi:hypothetical protein